MTIKKKGAAPPTTVRELLVAARDLISEPERWTQGWVARDINGNATGANTMTAVCWCAVGALYREGLYLVERVRAQNVLDGAAEKLFSDKMKIDHQSPATPAAQVNDILGHAAVMQMYQEAIANA